MMAPQNCRWWKIDDATANPPEDRDFLIALTNAGYRTFIAEGGLIGAICGERQVDVIHRGFGRRWRLGLLQSGSETACKTVRLLPTHADAVIAWLNGKALDEVMRLIDP